MAHFLASISHLLHHNPTQKCAGSEFHTNVMRILMSNGSANTVHVEKHRQLCLLFMPWPACFADCGDDDDDDGGSGAMVFVPSHHRPCT